MTEPIRFLCGEGIWHGEDGSRFAFRLDLEARGRRCEGTICWEADESGTEHVRGILDESTGELRLHGYRLDNPLLLSLDEYRLTLSPDGADFDGASRGPWGTWRNILAGQLRAG